MNEINWVDLALTFLGGFGLFLFGMEYMGEGLQKAAGSKMKNLLGVLTSNRLLGVLVGAGVTALIQSSSATTVMVVGFVNAGLMSLKQAVGVIMGANIGTTATAWIVALGDWTSFLKPAVLAPIFIVIGVVMIMFAKKQILRHIGQIVFGFGALFMGLENMSNAAQPLRQLEQVKTLFITLGSNPILGIVVGAVVTAIIQSSSASVGILQALATAGLVPWNSAIYIILGQNIGTCVTAALSSIGATTNAKRAAVIHFLFNLIGSIIFGIIVYIGFTFLVPTLGDQLIDVTQISVVHTVFNIVNTIILFPLGGFLVHLSELFIKDGKDKSKDSMMHLDERILETPSFAIESVIKEVIHMGELAERNVKEAVEALFEKNEEKIDAVINRERSINDYQHSLNSYLVKISNTEISETEHLTVTGLFHTVSDIERVSDHAENIVELAQEYKKSDDEFTEAAIVELKEIVGDAIKSLECALEAYKTGDKSIAEEAVKLEEKVDKMEYKLRSRHMKRLGQGQCTATVGILFMDTVSNVERISDHASKIANMILNDNKCIIIDEE